MEKILTIKDVAKKANVSISTVSRVLNNKTRVDIKTREKILRIIKEMNYEPNNIARSLSRKKTNTIGVIVEDIVNPFFSEVAKGIEETLHKKGYTMILTNSNYNPDEELELTKMLLRYKVDGIIITPVDENSKSIELLKARETPFIVMNCISKRNEFSWISSDNLKGGYIATKYLLELGHKKIMHIKGINIQASFERYEGFKNAIREKGLKLANQIVIGPAKTHKDAHDEMKKFIEKNGLKFFPTAIFAINDDVAIGALDILNEYGIKVPDDISIIGYDDIKIASYYPISLTTIKQPKYKMGEIAAKQLLIKIEKEEIDIINHFLTEPKLIIRNSCKELI